MAYNPLGRCAPFLLPVRPRGKIYMFSRFSNLFEGGYEGGHEGGDEDLFVDNSNCMKVMMKFWKIHDQGFLLFF